MQKNSDKNLLKDFQTFLKIYRSASEKTISNYTRDLQHFFEVLNITQEQQNDPDFLVKIGLLGGPNGKRDGNKIFGLFRR